MKNKKILLDFMLNIIASAMPIVVLQIIIFPQINRIEGEDVYGFIVTILSVITISAETVGNSLNNARILQQPEYEKQGFNGDFNLFVLLGTFIDIIAVIVGYSSYSQGNHDFFLVVVTSILILLRMYFIVAYRISLNYKNVLVNNCLLSLGYLLGFIVYIKTFHWEYIYIISNVCSLTHLYMTTALMREPFKKTPLFKATGKKVCALYASDIVKTFMTYADRLIIYPILGPNVVAHYYAATVMAKMISLVITPISSVLLSYLAKEEKPDKKSFVRGFFVILVLIVPIYVLAVFVSRVCVVILYKDMYEIVKNLLFWTVASSIVSAVISMIYPVVLRYRGTKLQLYINIVSVIFYIICCFVGVYIGNLTGFCIAYFISFVFKLLMCLLALRKIYFKP